MKIGNQRFQYIGKLDKNKLGKYKDKIITEEVVLTHERIRHIKERHPGDYEKYSVYIDDIIKKPDFVLEDIKNTDTIIMLKKINQDGKNIQLIIKLSTVSDQRRNKNSILTLWKVRNSTYNRMLKNKNILYKNE